MPKGNSGIRRGRGSSSGIAQGKDLTSQIDKILNSGTKQEQAKVQSLLLDMYEKLGTESVQKYLGSKTREELQKINRYMGARIYSKRSDKLESGLLDVIERRARKGDAFR